LLGWRIIGEMSNSKLENCKGAYVDLLVSMFSFKQLWIIMIGCNYVKVRIYDARKYFRREKCNHVKILKTGIKK
jgi:hypothetical protein